MTKRFNGISRTARNQAKSLGHNVIQMAKRSPRKWIGHCKKCGMDLIIELRPETGEDRIYGTAAVEVCNG